MYRTGGCTVICLKCMNFIALIFCRQEVLFLYLTKVFLGQNLKSWKTGKMSRKVWDLEILYKRGGWPYRWFQPSAHYEISVSVITQFLLMYIWNLMTYQKNDGISEIWWNQWIFILYIMDFKYCKFHDYSISQSGKVHGEGVLEQSKRNLKPWIKLTTVLRKSSLENFN